MENERISHARLFVANIKRLVLSKRYLVHLMLSLSLSIFSVKLLDAINQVTKIMPPQVFEAFKSGDTYNIGILTISRLDILSDSFHDELITGVLSGSFLLCIIATLISWFICSEYKNGYIAIAITHGQSRLSLYHQYLLASVLATVPILLFSILGVVCSLKIHQLLNIQDMGNIIQVIIIQIILIFFCSICFACASIAIKEYRAVALCVSSVFVFPLLPGYIRIFTGGKIDIERFSLFNLLIHSSSFSKEGIWWSLLMAIVTSVMIYLAGWACFCNRKFD